MLYDKYSMISIWVKQIIDMVRTLELNEWIQLMVGIDRQKHGSAHDESQWEDDDRKHKVPIHMLGDIPWMNLDIFPFETGRHGPTLANRRQTS